MRLFYGLKFLMEKTGLLKYAQAINRSLQWTSFYPINPNTTMAVSKCLKKLKETGEYLGKDYYEFGVFNGFTFWYAVKLSEIFEMEGMHFYGFDSFRGLPETTDKDNYFFQGDFSIDYDTVVSNFNLFELSHHKYTMVRGYFEEVLETNLIHKHKMKPAALILLDADLFQSTKLCLEFIKPLISRGTLIIIDEWELHVQSCEFAANNKMIGPRRAFLEFCSDHPEMKFEEVFKYSLMAGNDSCGAVFMAQ